MTERRMKLTPTNIALMGALVASLVGVGWQPVGAQQTAPQETPSQTIESDETESALMSEMDMEEADPFVVAAKAIGIDEEALWTELDAGKTVAQVSQANGVDPQTVINAVIASENALIDQELAAGFITEAEAQEWRTEATTFVNDAINKTLDELESEFAEGEFDEFDGEMHDDEGEWDEDAFAAEYLTPIATFLGTDVDSLEAGLESGKSLAQIAQENGKEPQALIDHMVAAEQAFIDELVAAGEITAEEAAEWSAELAQGIAFEVNHVEADPFDVAAKTMGIDEEALWTELEAGKTVAQVSQANGVDLQVVIDAVLASENALIDQELAAGFITEAEAQEWRTEAATFVNDVVNKTLDELESEFDEFDEEMYGEDEFDNEGNLQDNESDGGNAEEDGTEEDGTEDDNAQAAGERFLSSQSLSTDTLFLPVVTK